MGQERCWIVGDDLEHDGEHALREAVRLASLVVDPMELHVVHVIDGAWDVATTSRRMEDALQSLRARVLANVPCSPISARVHVRLGAPADEIQQVAIDYAAEMMVVGTHARRGVARLRHGSVAETLVRTARLPVLVARRREIDALPRTPRPDPARDGAAITGDQTVSEVLILGRRDVHIAGLL